MKNSETSGRKTSYIKQRRCEDRDREDVVDAGQHGIDTSDTEDDDDYDPPQIRVQTTNKL